MTNLSKFSKFPYRDQQVYEIDMKTYSRIRSNMLVKKENHGHLIQKHALRNIVD